MMIVFLRKPDIHMKTCKSKHGRAETHAYNSDPRQTQLKHVRGTVPCQTGHYQRDDAGSVPSSHGF